MPRKYNKSGLYKKPMETETRGRKKGSFTNIESFIISLGKKGEHFYSDKQDKHLTAIATNLKRKIKTERLICITAGKANPKAKYITKVTLF